MQQLSHARGSTLQLQYRARLTQTTSPTQRQQCPTTARRARHTLLNARVDLVVAEVQLDSALGTLVDEPVEGAR